MGARRSSIVRLMTGALQLRPGSPPVQAMKWELIEKESEQGASRYHLKVPGGWIVRTIYARYEGGGTSSKLAAAQVQAGHY